MNKRKKNEKNYVGFYLLTGLTGIFLALKLAHVIDWNWWWVFSPLWVPIAIIMVIAALIFLLAYFVGVKYDK